MLDDGKSSAAIDDHGADAWLHDEADAADQPSGCSVL
jgi:hypothetical protein